MEKMPDKKDGMKNGLFCPDYALICFSITFHLHAHIQFLFEFAIACIKFGKFYNMLLILFLRSDITP